MLNLKRFPKKYLTDFIKNIHNINIKDLNYNKKGTGIIQYGIDELFLNKYLRELLNKEESAAIYSKYSISGMFYNMRQYFRKHPETKQYVKEILGKYYDDKKSVNENIAFMDNVFYEIEEITPTAEYIVERFYSVIEKLRNNNKHNTWIPKKILDFIYKYNHFGVIYDESIYNIYNNKKHTIKNLKIPYTKTNNNIPIQDSGYYHKYMKYKSKYLKLQSKS